jgi:Protein of unknown function (DUF3662)/FHA domain
VVNSLERFERFFERLMEGSVGRIFRSPIQPTEIGRQLERAMAANKISTVDGIVVPNDYVVSLNPGDMVLFADFATRLCQQMEDWLIDLADERDYGFIDQVRVQLIGDDKISPRRIQVDATIAELPDHDRVKQESVQRTEVYRVVERTGNVPPKLLRVVTGAELDQTFVIRKPTINIGRSLDNDVVIDVPEVSRHHARLEYNNGVFQIADLGSTNGTAVNGIKVRHQLIQDGDCITLGTTVLEFVPYP